MDKEKTIAQYLEEMKNDLLKSDHGKKALEQAKEIILPALESWAKAKYWSLFGSDDQKLLAKEITKSCENSIDDVKEALAGKLTNYLVDKIISEVKSLALRHFLS